MITCRNCLYFRREGYPCAVQPLGCIAPDDEFCSECYPKDLFLWATNISHELLAADFEIVRYSVDFPVHTFRFMTGDYFPIIRELQYNTHAGWGVVINDLGQRLQTFVR